MAAAYAMPRGGMFRCRHVLLLLLLGLAIAAAALSLSLRREPVVEDAAELRIPTVSSASDLWVLSVGVSQYRDSTLNLHYASDDARSLANTLALQSDSDLYHEVHTQVLVDSEVTRGGLLAAIASFLGNAGPDDVVVLFLAGHGVQEPSTGSYYFLPYAAGRSDFITVGVRMSDISEALRALRRNVRRVLVFLDTCHAGAGQLAVSNPYATDPWVEESSDGFFLLAGARATEASKELPELGHGAFTWALLAGLRGAADADHDGRISVADLFAWVAREVPRLTGERQHPYQRIEGSDSPFAIVASDPATPGDAAPAMPSVRVANVGTALSRASIAVLRFDNLRGDGQHDWIGMALLSAFNTELTRSRTIDVYAPELLSGGRAMRADDLSAARRLGISKVLAGTYSVFGDVIRIDAWVIDSSTRLQEASAAAEGPLTEFFALQRRIVDSLRLAYPDGLPTKPPITAAIQAEQPLGAYKLLLEAEGLTGATPAPTPMKPEGTLGPRSSLPQLVSTALAVEPTAVDRSSVDALLERYRLALERADVDAYATVYSSFSNAQRTAIGAYFRNAQQLQVRISEVEISTGDSGPVVSFARHDNFLDGESGRHAELEVRLLKTLVKVGGEWKFAPPPQ